MKFKMYFFRTFLLIFSILLISASVIYSQGVPPETPINFQAAVEDINGGLAVKLTWTRNQNPPMPNFYHIYMAYGETEDITQFKVVQYIKNEDNRTDYLAYINQLHDGVYSFYITAVIGDPNRPPLESQPTEIMHVEIKSPPYVHILSKPSLTAIVGQSYTYFIKAESNIKCPILYELTGDIPEGMHFDSITGEIDWTPKEEGVYKLKIKAYLDCDNHVFAIQEFTLNAVKHNTKPYIKIVSTPIGSGCVGIEYIYNVKAETNLKCLILFELMGNIPPGMTIDKQTGVIRWIPQKAGGYTFTVKAFVENCDPNNIHTIQQICIKVSDCPNHTPPCAVISGQVRYEDGTPVPDGTIKLWRIDDNGKMTYFTVNIKDGTFTAKVPDGTYMLEISGKSFITEWYKDKETCKDAERIIVKCDDNITINIHVKKILPPKYHKVCGKVTAEKDGSPVLAQVEFIPIEFMYGRNTKNDINGNYFVAKTDAHGEYCIDLPDVHTYVARATSMMNSIQYLIQYYNLVADPTEADLIVVEDDVQGIDFILKEANQHQNGFSGIVINEDGIALKSQVIAYLVKPKDNNSKAKFSQSIETSDKGEYMFRNLIPGEYVVLSIPINRDYVPGYFKMNEIATLKWAEATRIEVDESMIQIIYEVKHRLRKGAKGIAQLDGVIGESNGSLKKGDIQLSGNPIAGAFVYIMDEIGEICNYGFTDDNGRFSMDEIGDGVYTLVADKVGYDTYITTVTTNFQEKSNQSLQFEMVKNEITSIDDPVLTNNSVKVYPSPAATNATIQFIGSMGNSNISIFNNLGIQIKSVDINAVAGLNNYNLNTVGYPNGVYFIIVRNGINLITTRFVVSK